VTQPSETIQAPAAKAFTAMGAGAGTSLLSTAQNAISFWPQTYGEWAAALASTVAFAYSVCLLSEWIWKRFIRPAFRSLGWITTVAADVDSERARL
jgi:hypothetical protein